MRQLMFVLLLLVAGAAFAQHKMKMQETSYHAPSKGVVRYDLYISDTTVNYAGKSRPAIAINGVIPAPVLNFTEGDTAEIYVHNTMHMETSVHWHGLILPNQYDGVSYLTTAPIKAGGTHLFRFPLVQSGTYWYHSHTMLQEQSGMYGALVIHKKETAPEKEYTLLLSDWTNDKPSQVDRRLHMATDWYAIRKNSVQSYGESLKNGHFKTKVTNEWKRMLAMDVSDVYYDQLLANGKNKDEQPDFKAGDKVRLRIVNGSSSTYFWLNYSGGKMMVVANDGMDVEPVEVDRLIVGVAETYDVIVTIPENKKYELLASSEDRTRSTSLFLGSGREISAKHLPRLKYFEGMKMMNDMMKMNGEMTGSMKMSFQEMDMNTVMYPEMDSADIVTLNYKMLRAPAKTTLPAGPEKVLHFNLTGNMNRYVWSINNKTVSETDKIMIKKGENVKIILYNGTMMRHPMHLHGHFFRVLNGQGEYAPLKNTLDIMPMETDTLEFAATESGDWFFHCHILYHMMSGMGRIFSYENSPPNPDQVIKKIYADDRKIRPAAKIGLESNGSDGELLFANTRYRLQTEWRIGLTPENGYESESHLGRYLGKMQWWFPYIGWDFRYRRLDKPEKNLFGQTNTKNYRSAFHVGVEYTLPMLVVADASIDTDGRLRFQLNREDIALGKRLRFNFMANTDKEYMAGFRYIVTKNFSFSTHYDSDMGVGAGITLNY